MTNNDIEFAFKKARPDAEIPKKMHEHDAGYDIFSYLSHDKVVIYPGEIYHVNTGILLQLPTDTVGLICPRSGLALKKKLSIINAPGVIDSNYRGELKILLRTFGRNPIVINHHERIAQLLIVRLHNTLPLVIEDDLVETDRGSSGFGSTGE